ncbi:MAG TPA: hypothetical protein VEA69_06700 [Tepidisphaeraceae bacterium]|nr:hypothetical protein [Tepidisphaeraceae bacterium]
MGAFYGSVQLKSEDRDVVVRLVEAVARERGVRCLIGPCLGGWIGAYPAGDGQDQFTCQAIAERAGGIAIQLVVHDSDVLAYYLWRDGTPVDSYWSRPGYFGEGEAEQAAMTGDPIVLAAIATHADSTPEKFARVLERSEAASGFVEERLRELARLLGIENACQSFESMKEEPSGVRGWREFVEVPREDVSREQEDGRARRARINAEVKRLKKSGALLMSVSSVRHVELPSAVVGGFAVPTMCGPGMTADDELGIELYSAPFKTPRRVLSTGPWCRVVAPRGGRFAVVSDGHAPAAVYSTGDDWAAVGALPAESSGRGVVLSDDGRLAATCGRYETRVVEVATGRCVVSILGHADHHPEFHPSGEWLVAGGSWSLSVAPIRPGARWREFAVGAYWDVSPDDARGGITIPSADEVDALIAAERAEYERSVAEMAGHLAGKPAGGIRTEGLVRLPADEQARILANHRRLQQRQLDERLAYLERLRVEDAEAPRFGGETPFNPRLSADGRFLFCGTDAGLRVVDWAEVATAYDAGETVLPAPRFHVDLSHQGYDFKGIAWMPAGHVATVAEEADGAGLVFGDHFGKVRRLDLRTGEVTDLFDLPEPASATHVEFSVDGRHLSVVSNNGVGPHRPQAGRTKCFWQIWDYRAIRH